MYFFHILVDYFLSAYRWLKGSRLSVARLISRLVIHSPFKFLMYKYLLTNVNGIFASFELKIRTGFTELGCTQMLHSNGRKLQNEKLLCGCFMFYTVVASCMPAGNASYESGQVQVLPDNAGWFPNHGQEFILDLKKRKP